MNLPDLTSRITERLSARARRELTLEGHKPAAVTVPLVHGPEGLSVLLTRRTEDVEHHKGEISFPGGGVEPGDEDTRAAALREAWEEVGLDPADVQVLGEMDDYYSISGYRVTPYVLLVEHSGYGFTPQPSEVSEILQIPLAFLLDPAHHVWAKERGAARAFHRFTWKGHVVWGLTASILFHFLRITMDFQGGAEVDEIPRGTPQIPFWRFVARDRRCAEWLQQFAGWLREEQGLAPEEAGTLAHAADRYLRDCVADILDREPEESGEALVRAYLGNWYIIHTLEPTHDEVDRIARALTLFHRWGAGQGHYPAATSDAVEKTLTPPDFFHARLESFWALTPERVDAWRDVDDYRTRIAPNAESGPA